ncbi:MAG: anthranilate synthase component I family protein [Polyangiaceae bacterium]|nr:anthranilate synthase component I family protein [Polyangiaceae bacterium]
MSSLRLQRASLRQLRKALRHADRAFWLQDEDLVHVGALPDRMVQSSSLPFQRISASLPSQVRGEGDEQPRGRVEWLLVLPYETYREAERGGDDAREEPWIAENRYLHYPASACFRRSPQQSLDDEVELVIEGESDEAVAALKRLIDDANEEASPSEPSTHLRLVAEEEPQAHESRIRRALEAIAAGELYQVNLARRFDFVVEGHALDLLHSWGAKAEAPFALALDLGDTQVVGSSPELFLDLEPCGRVRTRPIKGTRPRSADKREDERLRTELDQSEKEQAELTMVVDIERNDLGRLAEVGSVHLRQLPHVRSYPTVHHREAEVEAQIPSSVGLDELLEALLPSGSITGAPKVRAMEYIAELERDRRGLYTGAIGYFSSTGRLRLSMAIRVLTIQGHEARYYAGGGIVADSDPLLEIQETRWKAAQLPALAEDE